MGMAEGTEKQHFLLKDFIIHSSLLFLSCFGKDVTSAGLKSTANKLVPTLLEVRPLYSTYIQNSFKRSRALLPSFPLISIGRWAPSACLKAAAPTWHAEVKDVEPEQDRSFLTAEWGKHHRGRKGTWVPEAALWLQGAWADVCFGSTQFFHPKRFYCHLDGVVTQAGSRSRLQRFKDVGRTKAEKQPLSPSWGSFKQVEVAGGCKMLFCILSRTTESTFSKSRKWAEKQLLLWVPVPILGCCWSGVHVHCLWFLL